MAQGRAGPAQGEEEPETSPGAALPIPEPAPSSHDLSSVDNLLALTDDGWEIEQQLQTLKQATLAKPLSETAPRPTAGKLHLPTPYELAPTAVALRVDGLVAPAPDSSPPSGKPPPLPSGAKSSKRPPPLPPPPKKAAPAPVSIRTPEPSDAPSPAPSRRGALERSSASPSGDLSQHGTLIDLLNARISTLEEKDDKVGLARAHVELAVASETILADDVRATMHAEAALKVDPHYAAAHALLRRRKHGRAHLPTMLSHLDQELASASAEASIVELLAEKARLLDACADKGDAVRATWEQALSHAPLHAAALKGLESELVLRAIPARDEAGPHEALAAHLARLADAYGSEPALAAWLHVERAQILEKRLGKADAARAALERALALDEGVGPVRDAYTRHLSTHGDWAALAKALDDEAGHETLDARCAALELDAAILADHRLGDDEWATRLLERAMARAPTEPFLDRRVLDELVRLREARSQWQDAARARRGRLRFLGEPRVLAYELRALALLGERLGDIDGAIADVQRALSLDASDPTLVETLDRLLGAAAKDEQRVALWLTEAARTDDGTKRARALGRAAQIAENVLGRPLDAIRHLRSAWVAAPGDSEVLDSLARLLSPSPSEAAFRDLRALVELYTQAADTARDPGRRIAYLEKVALLWEELLGEPARAARVYEEILSLDGDRRSALLGLERSAQRLGDARTLAKALLDEARLSTDGGQQLALKTRAAAALAKVDASRALSLVNEVLENDPAHTAARSLETRLNDEAGRWELAARSLYARIDVAPASERVGLWLALSELQRVRLHAPLDSLASLESARELDPSHPVPPEEIAKLLEATRDFRNLRPAVEKLANAAATAEDRVRFLVQAAEIDELRLGDDANAARLYQRALAEAPDNELVADRLVRVLARRAESAGSTAGHGELATLLSKRIERATSPATALILSFDLALLLSELGTEPTRAAALLESVIAEQPDHVPALRALEVLRRRAGEWSPLARVLSKQGETFTDVRARLASLWSLAFLEEWRLPASDATSTYRRILELDPSDPGALEATLRRDLPAARRGDALSRRAVVSALRPLVALASDDTTRLSIQLRLALILETAASEATDVSAPTFAHEALARYRDALRIDELSVTAATGVARLATRLGDVEGALAAATTLAELAVDTRVRARYLVDAAELLLGPDEDDRLGPRAGRRERAAKLLEQAIESEPDSIAAAGRLATVLLEDRRGDRLVVVFREALVRAKSPDAAVMLGSEIARVARDDLKDLTMAIDAMRRVREMAPQHVPSLLTLAELCIAQRAWPEAVEALEAVVSASREVAPRLTALFALASVYEKVLSRPEEVERVLRAALALEPSNPRALRALLRRIAQAHAAEDGKTSVDTKREVESLLSRLAEVEKDPDQKSAILLELSEARLALSDPAGSEAALVEAVATSPNNARAFARLSTFYKQGAGPARDHVGYARALSSVITTGQELGRLDPRWFAALGQLEVDSLGRMRDGIVHLQRAVAMDADLFETRFELASAYARLSANDEATRTLLAMLTPNPRPILSVADPAAALELLERTLGAERRAEEAIVVSELRAIAGELDDGRHAWLRARRLPPFDGHAPVLDRPTLVTHVLPPEARHILLEVAAAVAGIEAKVLRADLSELGISSRDRVTTRSGHPTRLLLDRLAKQLGLTEIELVVTPNVARMRVLSQDVPWVVVPRALTEMPEPAQVATLARAVARVAYGTPWLEELAPPHIEALLVAAARQVVPGYALDHVDVLAGKLVAQYEAGVARALSRRQKKLLEELSPHIAAPQGRLMPIDAFVAALARAELRAAFILGGDLLASLDEIRAMDVALHRATESPSPAALTAVLEHPYAGDVIRFALTPEATALRRRVGTAWTGA